MRTSTRRTASSIEASDNVVAGAPAGWADCSAASSAVNALASETFGAAPAGGGAAAAATGAAAGNGIGRRRARRRGSHSGLTGNSQRLDGGRRRDADAARRASRGATRRKADSGRAGFVGSSRGRLGRAAAGAGPRRTPADAVASAGAGATGAARAIALVEQFLHARHDDLRLERLDDHAVATRRRARVS